MAQEVKAAIDGLVRLTAGMEWRWSFGNSRRNRRNVRSRFFSLQLRNSNDAGKFLSTLWPFNSGIIMRR